MKKKCPICNKMIIIDEISITSGQPSSLVCPKCGGALLCFYSEFNSTTRLEARDIIPVKCPICNEKIHHSIVSHRADKRLIFFTDFHQTCPSCGTALVVHGIIENKVGAHAGSVASADVDTFAPFPSAYYVIAAKRSFMSTLTKRVPTARIAKATLKALLALPDDNILKKVKRYRDYGTVPVSIKSYIVNSPEKVEAFLPANFSVIYASDNLLAKEEKRGGFLRLLEILILLTNSVKDVCGKAAITDSVIHDLGTIPSEVPYKWSKDLQDCLDLPGYNIFSPLYQSQIFIDFENLVGFRAERHLYKPCNEAEIIKAFREDTWYIDYGCVHSAKIMNYATKNAVNPDAVVEVLTNAGIPIFELEKDTIDWHNYEKQFSSLKLKEDALGFPAGRSIRQALGNESSVWKSTRKAVLENQNFTCQICGYHTEETKYLHAHEVWSEVSDPNVLCLTDIQLLCNRCHDCKHIGQFLMRNATNSEPYDRMIMHMSKVNNCSPEVIYAYHKYRIEHIQKRHEEKMHSQLVQCCQVEDNSASIAGQKVKYVINDNVTNSAELIAALDKNGLIFHEQSNTKGK